MSIELVLTEAEVKAALKECLDSCSIQGGIVGIKPSGAGGGLAVSLSWYPEGDGPEKE